MALGGRGGSGKVPWEGADPRPCLGPGSTRNGGPYTGSQNSPGSGYPPLNRGGDCSPGRLERGGPSGWAAQEDRLFLFRL